MLNTFLFSLLTLPLLLLIIFFVSEDLLDTKPCQIIFTVIIIIILLSGIYYDYKSYTDDWHIEKTATEKIISLEDNIGMNGRFYLRHGYLNSIEYYHYMVDLRNGGYKANKVKAKDTTIYEVNSDFRVEWYTKTKGYAFSKEEYIYWKIYVPKGSIAFDNYNIDLQ